MNRIWRALGILLLGASVSPAQNLITGEKAPELKTGEWLSKGNYTGSGKATVIEFFFSRSEPSMKRLSVLDGFVRSYGDSVGVVLLAREPREQVGEAVNGKGYGFGVALDDNGKTFDAYGVQFVPFAVLYDAKGKILWFGNSSKFGNDELERAMGWK